MDIWNFSIIKTNKKSINKWRKHVNKNTLQHDYIIKVINDAINKNSVIYSARYYACAKFVMYYNTSNYKFKKEPVIEYSCCNAYPIICGGKCCKYKFRRDFDYYEDCGCNKMPQSNNAKYRIKKIGLCYHDCCCFYKIINRHKFKIVWV